MRRTIVCHVSLGLTTGGMERLLVDFARFHDAGAVEAHFLALDEIGEPAREIRALGVAVHRSGDQGPGASRLWRLVRFFRDLAPTVVHTHGPAPQFWGGVAARLAGVPAVIHTQHGQPLSSLPWPLIRVLCRLADRVVCVSDDLRQDLWRRQCLPEGRVLRIWNGIDVARFAWAGPRLEPTAIAVSRLSPVKDVRTLLHAAGIVRRQLPDFRLRIVGDGSERGHLEEVAEGLALGRSVEFLGERHDVPALLAEAGVFASSSLSEGLSLTLAEAMAVGLPVVATAVGGNSEVVVEGLTGRLVAAGDPQGLAAAFLALWAERNRWVEMGRAGRERVLAHFQARRMVKDYEALYASVLG